MDGTVEEILRRLLLLGLPLIPSIGCGGSPANGRIGCATQLFDGIIAVPRPDSDPDGGPGITIADWDACATVGDCAALCKAVAATGFASGPVKSCDRVRGGGDAGSSEAGSTVIMEPGDANAPTVDVHLAYTLLNCTGRRPEGFHHPRRTPTGRAMGRWLADVATLEAASVPAFRRLARELRAHAAPPHLVRGARESALDEVRHYKLTARSARARGAVVQLERSRRFPIRDLLSVATENVREGCVRETFGAVSAAHQAAHARDPELRALMTIISRDEARHAFLAWQIDNWARSVLPAPCRVLLDDAKRIASAELARAVAAASPPPRLASAAGLPSGRSARTLLERTRTLLWAV
jgi:hypothetical protein